MKGSRRRTAAKIVLPGIAAAALYVVFFALGGASRLGALSRSLEAARKDVPPSEAIAREDERKRGAKAEVDRLQAELDELRRGEAAAAPGGEPKSGLRASEELTRILERHHLQLGEETPQSAAGGPQAPAPAGSARLHAPGLRLRNHRFSGSYLDVMAALEEIAALGTGIIPVRLTMARSSKKGEPLTWTFILWM